MKTLTPSVTYVLISLFGLLVVASLIVFFLKRSKPEKDYTELSQRISSWWIMTAVFSLAMVLSRNISVVFMGFMSFLALKEYFSLIPTRRADRRVLFWAYVTIPFQFYWVSIAWYGMFIIWIPVYAFLFLPMRMVLIGETKEFLRAVGLLHWGLMTTVFSISHLAFLLVLPVANNPAGGGAGWVLLLVVLTQLNDVAQYCWGKLLGKNKIVPLVSPNKTIEGFLGGVVTTTLLCSVLAPLLTPISGLHLVTVGLLVSVAGFIGDVTISALKRDLGVKDSGNLLPGHGGILDRIDSLTYTAPLFFHYIYYFYN